MREYATYVLHLEAALSQADLLLTHAQTASTSRRHSKTLASHPSGKLSMLLLSLEELAAERGESGLIISLSKPFQRLLKYPLLFQNLLFNTDPSMKEYERTLDMVDEVEQIVRGIEDEKVDYEEKERTRDAWARIDGLEGGMVSIGIVTTGLDSLWTGTRCAETTSTARLGVAGRCRRGGPRTGQAAQVLPPSFGAVQPP